MKPTLILRSSSLDGFSMESIDSSHLELIRRWRNANRDRFFFQEEITTHGQQEWYAGYLQRPEDWIFVIRENGGFAGCAGYRIMDGAADIHTVLRNEELDRRSSAIAHGIDLLTNYIAERHGVPIRAQVLADNPAQRWARPRGFVVVGSGVKGGLAYNNLEQVPALRVPHRVIVATAASAIS